MKKPLLAILIACLIISACTANLESPKDGLENQGSGIENEPGSDMQPKSYVSDDASVEVLVQLSLDFLYAAYGNDVDGMSSLCSDSLRRKIKNSPKTYLGTKPEYNIEKVDTTIRPTESKGKYLIYANVTAVKKSDKKIYEYRYSVNIDKVKGDYFITEFKRVY